MSSAMKEQINNYINKEKIKYNDNKEKFNTSYNIINSLTLPYKYFKKMNILPLNIVEGEIDKYFNIKDLLAETNNQGLQYEIGTYSNYMKYSLKKLKELKNYKKYLIPLNEFPDGCMLERSTFKDYCGSKWTGDYTIYDIKVCDKVVKFTDYDDKRKQMKKEDFINTFMNKFYKIMNKIGKYEYRDITQEIKKPKLKIIN
jgi:hypothetical protein